jgi:hypothetical protein
MHIGAKKQTDSGAISLQNVVVCVDCESVMDSHFEQCPKCGSRSILGIARMLGKALPLHKANCLQEGENIVRFDLEFTIDVEQMELKDLNAAIQHITSLIGARLVRGRARCHIKVEPVADCHANEGDAA